MDVIFDDQSERLKYNSLTYSRQYGKNYIYDMAYNSLRNQGMIEWKVTDDTARNLTYGQLEQYLKNIQRTDMNNDTTRQVDLDLENEMTKRRHARLLAEKMKLVDALGEDTYDEGTVLLFTKKFEGSPKEHTYVVLKVADKWHSTDGCSHPRAWEDLITWMVSGAYPVTSFTKLVKP